MPVNKDTKLIKELLDRGTENIYPSRGFLEKALKSGKKQTLYLGIDPTAPTLHVGHGIALLKLAQFQKLGHKIILLIGDFTAMIGDPTDKTAARTRLTPEEIKKNFKAYKKQASQVLDFSGSNPAEVKYNSKWLGKMSFADVLDLASNFTVQRMFERDMFQKRVKDEKPIYLHEFFYPMMQGYDTVAMDVDGEIGGNDQTFNMLAGRTLMKSLKNKEKFVVTVKLLADASGKKMSKTENNMIALSDAPEDVFGKVMRWTDGMIETGFELCTTVPMAEVKKMDIKKNPRDAKLRLAYEVTKTFLGEKAAEKGKKHFASVIQSNEKPADMEKAKVAGKSLLDALVDAGLVKSKSDARRTIDGGGVRINDEKVSDYFAKVSKGDIIQKGKRHFVEVC